MRDLTPAQWQFIASRLYAGLEPGPDVAAERARLLVERIESSALLQEMVKTPLMVWTATIIHYAGRQLPEQRAELYHAYVSVLLGERLHEEEGAEFGDHLTVQEFLAANYLVDNLRGRGEAWTGFLQEHVGRSWWREVFLLMAGYLLQWPQQARRFLIEELAELAEAGDQRAFGLAWAGRALLEIPPHRVGWYDTARQQLARQLADFVERHLEGVSVPARVEAGQVLARLGDSRPGVGCSPLPLGEGPGVRVPDILWCHVPKGPFLMGSDKERDPEAWDDELSQHEHPLPYDYLISRYPITNEQFQAFVDDTEGYRNDLWWTHAGLRWRGQRAGPERYGSVFDLPNHLWSASPGTRRWPSPAGSRRDCGMRSADCGFGAMGNLKPGTCNPEPLFACLRKPSGKRPRGAGSKSQNPKLKIQGR